jgi:4-amino-4-deoxy-L-arabinose transferase-like glycosyltransferase
VSKRTFSLCILALVLVVAWGSRLDVMEVDAAQYAGMSRDMLRSGEYLQLEFRGEDYLDKPPLLFWLSALSFKVFGVHDWSYRLPSILFAFLGIYSTYRFAVLYHGITIARTAALMFGGSTAFLLMTNDVRCDTILTATVITAIWMGSAWLRNGRTAELLGFALAIGAGLLVKGPIAAVAPMLAVGGQLVFTRAWRKLLDLRLGLVPLVVGVMLLPMCIGLYQQFGVNGLRFYFWEQSFGRITGENRWVDDSTFLFFTHELPWQVLPWVVFVGIGVWVALRDLFTLRREPEHASTIGAVSVFLALSFSHFKLPHYLYVTLPLFAVLGARALHRGASRGVARLHYGLLGLLWALVFALVAVVFPSGSWPFLALLIGLLVYAVRMIVRNGLHASLLQVSFALILVIGAIMNGHFYPRLLEYQANAKVGQWVAERGIPQDRFHGLQVSGTALDYYAGYPVGWLSNAEEAKLVIAPGTFIYTDAARREELRRAGLVAVRETVFRNYPVQLLGADFLLPSMREAVVAEQFVLEF